MNKRLQILFLLLFCAGTANATKLKGHVYDKQTGEAIVGATVVLENPRRITNTGLDGTFEFKDVKAGAAKISVSYITYKTIEKTLVILKEDNDHLKFYMESDSKSLDDITIKSNAVSSTDQGARRLEKSAPQLMNIVSGRSIEISPDLTVANVMQRISGVSIERNSNGDGQYAILRGMDKRYNYTLVNGVKIPSPDNKYRYVPLDLFPSDLLDRLEVYKTLTPNLEGDAIGGAINMVMKNAPGLLQVNANVSTGYNQLFFDRKFTSYNASDINYKSPYEINGKNYNATQNDFSKGTLDYKYKTPAPNLIGSLSLSKRFLDNKLGVVLAGSYQNTYRGSNSTFYNNAVVGSDAYAKITSKSYREFSEQQQRTGLHGKVDYVFNKDHQISLYNVYVNLKNQQVRDAVTTTYNGVYNPTAGNAELVYDTRSRLTEQQIYNTTLHGDHKFFDDKFKVQWSAVYSSAKNDVPENTSISLNGIQQSFQSKRTSLVNTNPVTRRWERNTDEDLAGYLDLTYQVLAGEHKLDIMAGGLYRDKQRSSFFNNYNLAPSAANAFDLYGVNFQNYTDLNLVVSNSTGAVANALTYDATEKIAAGYGMFKYNSAKLEVIGGLRVEHTNQGYNLLFPAGEAFPNGNQIYTDLLPSLTAKYFLSAKAQLHASYYKALNRPGFYEIVPGKVVNEDFVERGNVNLQRALADNFDLRYELFPGASEQLLVGAFYKRIKNPIEYTFQADAVRGQDIYYTPGNFGTANNYGAEVDYIKYFSKIGVKANYTYTHSRIVTPKTTRSINSTTGDIQALSVDQERPLYGQSAHIANLSLLFKDTKKGWDVQVAGAYTGPRINTVSQFLNNDLWQEGFIQMDASAEKRFKGGISVFVKANNILNTPTKLFIKGTNPENDKINEDLVKNGNTLIRSDYYGQNYLVGFRYKFN
ncbi:outer membrane beta-barrel protein [Pedobacter sp. ISL-68]|uniref:TonB-dependent receptor n=1 Tax=unclassified Pedobacter TaxID=2628915 RepID=UPI001BEABD63|nr:MULTISPECIES: TonB-dependent receptor [unclassified Pedobacter]MBT2563845.1 outer membrane beta-barrel protein [Pedobacter sp. ISL-64]MBT2592749.1 outer membrane beta-barrel protein [Pedobacter sp. ISL-68]